MVSKSYSMRLVCMYFLNTGLARNFDQLATLDNRSCVYTPALASAAPRLAAARRLSATAMVDGCTDPEALNYDVDAKGFTGCTYGLRGCTDSSALNYMSAATTDDGACVPRRPGCAVPGVGHFRAVNYNATATVDDGSCRFALFGCTDSTSPSFLAAAERDDGSCVPLRRGCQDAASADLIMCSYPC